MKKLPITKYFIFLPILLFLFGNVHCQDIEYLKLKERYIGGEIETGLIMNQPAYSIGFGVGRVQNNFLQLGLSLQFLLNNITQPRVDGNEELRKLNLLGLETQYYRPLANRLGYYGTLGLHIGTAQLNKLTTPDIESWSGFTGAVKPKVGLFYKINQRSEIYFSVKYMLGFIIEGTKRYQGVPLISFGARFREIGF